MRIIWFTLGGVSLFLAFLGVLLPLLPTVPFLLVSAFFFAKSSEKVHDWLISHKLFGTMIRDWHERGAIALKSKYFATVSIVSVVLISLLFGVKLMVIYLQIFVLSLVLLFIWTRPNN
ncbi:MAG: Unknown protein [uncultured Sulfurovum sp.]|uniref:DUF454 domain-containing protein n=1 Tax=uncultured Sulfurovum sp. TaxID=269237 RepID=A0A6S6T5J7_9BACT|nr:MAG: Unknown protein [uncultured Sulfurovum sp.]